MGHLGEHAGSDPLTQAAVTDEELAHVYAVLSRFFLKHTKVELAEEAQRRRIILFPAYGTRPSGASSAHRQKFFPAAGARRTGCHTVLSWRPIFVKPNPMATAAASALIGEHNEAIYGGELGLSQAELAVLMAAGAI